MSRDISKERAIVDDFINIVGGRAFVTIYRGDGSVEGPWVCSNQVTAAGLNELASRSIVTSRSPFDSIAVGSGTAAASLGSTALIHQVSSKASITPVTSRSTLILSNTWGGAADSVTSIALEEAGIFNLDGTMLNKLTGVAATLGDSDIVNLAMTFQIGSHAL